ncbi:MAG: hypothetical protein WA814_08380 [Candidatus Baltobacteraceae bacterium]
MLRRIEVEEPAASLPLQIGASRSEAVVPAVAEAELETSLLPQEHPRWVKDAIAVSQRAREIVARLKPVAIFVLSFWDHRVRAIAIGERCVHVDPSGCYRADT